MLFPDQGQGAAMGFEDAACLMVLLAHLSSKDEIPARLELFQKLRIKRVSAMQIFSSVGQDEAHKIAKIVKPFVDGAPPSKYLYLRASVWGKEGMTRTRL